MHRRLRIRRYLIGFVTGSILLICLLGAAFLLPEGVVAGSSSNREISVPVKLSGMLVPGFQDDQPGHPPADQSCRLCHGESTAEIHYPSGESLSVMVDLDALSMSAHGDQADSPLACTDCHAPSDYQYPHSEVEAADLRSYEIDRSETCERCHQQPHFNNHPGIDSDSPVLCTDCHGSHDVVTVEQWQNGQGTGTCIACHTEQGIERVDPIQLTQMIRAGLFADEPNSDYCLACHSQEDLTFTFDNGDELSLTIDREDFYYSVHGVENEWRELECRDCHGRYLYPHPEVEVTSEREYNLERYPVCANCHERFYERTVDSVHGEALAAGNAEAAVCTDCHGAHDTPPPDEPRERISQTCGQCHTEIFDDYTHSVHGEALLEDSNPDVPTCIDCHGVHDIHDPTTELARRRSPLLCAECHGNEELMTRYGISTEVFNTYVADFHGTTATLFDPKDPEAELNVAVCYDCHGVHNIRPTDDPDSGIRSNLLETCRRCHPNASENFPAAWTSHYQPSLEHYPIVFLVEQFYSLVIPVTVGGLGFLVATDVFRRVRKRLKR